MAILGGYCESVKTDVLIDITTTCSFERKLTIGLSNPTKKLDKMQDDIYIVIKDPLKKKYSKDKCCVLKMQLMSSYFVRTIMFSH